MHNLLLDGLAHLLKPKPNPSLDPRLTTHSSSLPNKNSNFQELLDTIESLELKITQITTQNEQFQRDIGAISLRANRAEHREKALKSVQHWKSTRADLKLEEMQNQVTGLSQMKIQTQKDFDKAVRERDKYRENLTILENQKDSDTDTLEQKMLCLEKNNQRLGFFIVLFK